MQHNIETAPQGRAGHPQLSDGQGFFEIETPVHDALHAGGRARLPGAQPRASGRVLRPAAVAAAVQADPDDRRLRPLLPDCACFRDEDLRADRQPEFTQIDLEMCFPQQETIFAVVEGFLTRLQRRGLHDRAPFPQMTYDEAIRLYGIDKPDLRLPAMTDVSAAFSAEQLETLAIDPALPDDRHPHSEGGRALAQGARRAQGAASRKTEQRSSSFSTTSSAWKRTCRRPSRRSAKLSGAAERATCWCWWPAPAAGGETPAVPAMLPPQRRQPAAKRTPFTRGAGQLRLALAQKYAERHGLSRRKTFQFPLGHGFPDVRVGRDRGTLDAAHHPFTSLHEDHMELLHEGVRRYTIRIRRWARFAPVPTTWCSTAPSWARARSVSTARMFRPRSSTRWA